MKLVALEKSWTWPRMNQDDELLEAVRLYDLAIAGHVQIDFPMLTTVVEWWEPKYNTFHLPMGEISITFLDVYCI